MCELWYGVTHCEECYLVLVLFVDCCYCVYCMMVVFLFYEELIVMGVWWDYVDVVVTQWLCELWFDVVLVLCEWLICVDMWKCCLVIIVQVICKGDIDFVLLVELIEFNCGDCEFFICKVIGWVLRAYVWIELEVVIVYCDVHELFGLSWCEVFKNIGFG